MRKYLLPLLILCMVILGVPFAIAAEETVPNCTIRGNEVVASPDLDVTMTLTIENNPGISGAEIIVSFDERLTLVSAEAGEAFSALTYVAPSYYRNPTVFMWDSEKINDEDIKDGIILELTFHIPAGVEGEFPVTITYESGNIFDKDLNPMELTMVNGSISSISYIPGDADGNGRLNTLDITAIRRYISDGRKTDPNGYNVVINENAADVDGNGRINTLDITMLRRYISDGRKTDPNGYNIVLKPGKMSCEHDLTATIAKAPTCSEPGNIAYWHCSKCGKYFSDAESKYEVLFAHTTLNATGHTYADDWSHDENAHWRIATCEHSSEVTDYAAHTFVDQQCSICGISETFYQKFTVKFVDFDNSIIDIQTVDYGCDATKPSDPIRKNYAFIGWDTIFTNVDRDLTVKARYVRQYTVTFLDYDGSVIATEVVKRGDTATPPEHPCREGYTFSSWDQSYTNVVSDLEIVAVYEINRYSVTFLHADGSVISKISNVAHGTTVTPPKTEDMYFDWSKTKGYRFTGWKNWDETQPIVHDIAITADYSEGTTEPIIAIETKEIRKGTTTAEVSVYLCGTLQDVYGMRLKLQYAEQLALNNTSVVVNSKLIGSESALNAEKSLYELSWVDGRGININERLEVLTLTFNIDKYVAVGEYGMELLEGTYIIDGNLSKHTPIIVEGHITITE